MLFFFFLLVAVVCFFFFFFSSRRRHTRCLSDWSSDVCSSDLIFVGRKRIIDMNDFPPPVATSSPGVTTWFVPVPGSPLCAFALSVSSIKSCRSEERRVGKECRYRCA